MTFRLPFPRVAAGIAVAMLWCGAANAATQLFPVQPSVPLPMNLGPVPAFSGPSLLSGDLNGDGLADTVVFGSDDTTPSNLLVLLNTKGGVPTLVTTPLTNCSFPEMAIADLNKDGKLDLVVSCGANYVQAFLGVGDGTFQPAIASQTASYAIALTLGDFNGDGLPDLAYLTGTGYAIALNTGGGHFASSAVVPVAGGSSVSLLASGDFNGDGKQDLVVAGSLATAAYLPGNGDGTCGTPVTIAGAMAQIAVGDFNGDGYSDLAYFTQIYQSSPIPAVVVLAGGSGGLPQTGLVLPAPGASPVFLAAVALVPGGPLDLVLGNGNAEVSSGPRGNTLIYPGDGKGGFQGPEGYAADSVFGVADLNGDGIPDLAGFGYPYNFGMPYAPGNGDGTFQALPNTPVARETTALAVADFNGDGVADSVVFDAGGRPEVFLGRGDGRFTATPNGALPSTAPGFLIAADFNGDGKTDVASILPGISELEPAGPEVINGAIVMLLGNGDGSLSPQPQASLNIPGITAALSGDFNGDKKQDLFLIYSQLLNPNTPYAVFLPGNGDGTFGAATPVTLVQTNSGLLQAADLNGDGITDLIDGGISYLGSASGTFTLLQVLPADGWVEDLNGDGKLELVGFATNSAVLNVYTGNADGTFSSTPQSSVASASGYLATGDVNGDGLPDLVVLTSNGLTVHLNQGGGSFTLDPTVYFTGPSLSNTVSLVRLNASSAASGAKRSLDILADTSGGLTALLNTGNAAPRPAPDVNVSLAGGVTSIPTGSSVTIDTTLFAAGGTAPMGSVTFYAGGAAIGTATVTDGMAGTTAPIAGSGTVVIRAVYSGDSHFASATGYTSVVIQAPVATTTTLAASATSVNTQQPFTLTATVQGSSPTGTMTFLNGATALGTAPLANGSASLTTSFANAGTVSVTASYGGDANNLGSVSAPVAITVAAPGFSVAASPATATIAPGQSAKFTLTVAPAGGFNSAVSFACGTLPSLATCAFSSSSVTPAGGQPAAVTLTISTVAASAQLRESLPAAPRRSPWLPGGAVLGFAGVFGWLRRRGASLRDRSWMCGVVVGFFFCGVGLCVNGCGGGKAQVPANPGTPAGASMITITASSSGSAGSQNASVQLTVQ